MKEHNSKAELQEANLKHHLHPFTGHKNLVAEGGARIITKADGIYVEDVDGNRLIDGMSGLWCVAVGYGQKSIADACHEQMQELPYYNTFFHTSHPRVIELGERLAKLTPDGIDTFFYGSSGSESNDTNFRIVHRYWQLKGKESKKWFISRKNSYHGSTVFGASLGGKTYMHDQAPIPMENVTHIEEPYTYKAGKEQYDEEFGMAMAKTLEDKILELGADNVAAFIGEPIQGAGGVIIPPKNYWPEIRRICDKYDILLIADEVICGFGRAGEWFGCQAMGFTPDLMTMAKCMTSGYLPLSAVGLHDKVADVLKTECGGFMHGYTYSAHPVACAAALANLDIIENEKLIEKIKAETGDHFAKKMKELEQFDCVGEARSMGMIGAFELTPNKATREPFDFDAGTECRNMCMANNVIIRGCGPHTMVSAPPLTITVEELDEMFVRIHKSLAEFQAKHMG